MKMVEQVEKITILERLELTILAIDEIIDSGSRFIFECRNLTLVLG